jgi:hypothetical protein
MASFAPAGSGVASTVSLSATSTTGNVALAGVATGQAQCEIQNKGNGWAYVAFGGSTVAATVPNGATAGSYAVGPGQSKIVSIGSNAQYAAGICASGDTATLLFTVGYGDS